MGFIYTKSMSIEEVFSKFDTNHDGKISGKEAKKAKKMDIFSNFKVTKGMTLETFENTNKDVYAGYENASTKAYNKQQAKVKQWMKSTSEAMIMMQDSELRELEDLEKELEQEKEELERTLAREKENY